MARNVKSAFDGIVGREMHREMHLHLGDNRLAMGRDKGLCEGCGALPVSGRAAPGRPAPSLWGIWDRLTVSVHD